MPRELHRFILDRIELALGDRSWSWLAREANFPRSTLVTQKQIPKFSVATLVAIAAALGRPIPYFLPQAERDSPASEPDILEELEELLRRHRAE